MKVYTTKFYTITILSLLAFVMASSVCSAQQWSRSGKTDIYGILQMMSGEKLASGAVPGVGTVEYGLDDATLFGIGIGYNIDNHWNINTDLIFGSQDVYGKALGVTINITDADVFLWNVNMDYNFFEDRLTPLVSVGVGYGTISADVLGFEIVDISDFTYNLGVGARCDITDNFFIKAMYRITWFENIDQDGISLGIGYMF